MEIPAPQMAKSRSWLHRATAFPSIGMSKALTIQIRHVYTGQFPRHKFRSRRKDMLGNSALKDLIVFNAATRATNFLRKGEEPGSNMNSPAAQSMAHR
jgi:hypothetical protein